jgi:hypothetical protein
MAFFCPILAPPLCARRTLAVPRRLRRDKGTARVAARHVPVSHATSPVVRHGFWRRSSSRVAAHCRPPAPCRAPIGQSRGASPALLRQEAALKTPS